MASSMKLPLVLFFACSLFIQGTLAEVICEKLPENLCAFAVASSGKRCVLENYENEDGSLGYTCTSSEEVVESLAGHIESDQCVSACGADRRSVGISSDAFLSAEFTSSLCSPPCFQNCPNIVDLYFNLAAAEGVFLPHLCQKQKSNPHRAMLELLSSGGGAPASANDFAPSPAPHRAMLELLSSGGGAPASANDFAPSPAPHRAMLELLSSGGGALASANDFAPSPAPAPAP